MIREAECSDENATRWRLVRSSITVVLSSSERFVLDMQRKNRSRLRRMNVVEKAFAPGDEFGEYFAELNDQ